MGHGMTLWVDKLNMPSTSFCPTCGCWPDKKITFFSEDSRMTAMHQLILATRAESADIRGLKGRPFFFFEASEWDWSFYGIELSMSWNMFRFLSDVMFYGFNSSLFWNTESELWASNASLQVLSFSPQATPIATKRPWTKWMTNGRRGLNQQSAMVGWNMMELKFK